MYNWSTDTKELKKDKKKYAIWRLEQLVNFGLGKEKIERKVLEKYLHKLKIPENRRAFLELILWNKKF